MPVSNQHLIQTFTNHLKFEKRYSIHTLTSYNKDLLDFFAFVAGQYGETAIKKVSFQYVRSWLANLKDNGLKPKSISRKISSLKSFFKFLMKEGLLEVSPASKVVSPKIGKRLPVFVNEEDTRMIVKSLARSTEDWKSVNAKMLITIFYATGMRLSELITLKEKQIDVS